MTEQTGLAEKMPANEYRALAMLAPLFLVLAAAILLWGRERVPAAEEPPPPVLEESAGAELLVTADQLAQMAYTDSVLGPVRWDLSEQSVKDLNRVLEEYGIRTAEEISQFLAQAAVETVGGRYLTELGTEEYFRGYGYTAGTRGAGFLHLTFEYGQMAFATWMMKRCVPELAGIDYRNPTDSSRAEITGAYYAALRLAANLGLDVSAYTRAVHDPQSPVVTGADYIAQAFPWESAGYYWHITGIGQALSDTPGTENTDVASRLVGGGNWQSRREAYLAIFPVLNQQDQSQERFDKEE